MIQSKLKFILNIYLVFTTISCNKPKAHRTDIKTTESGYSNDLEKQILSMLPVIMEILEKLDPDGSLNIESVSVSKGQQGLSLTGADSDDGSALDAVNRVISDVANLRNNGVKNNQGINALDKQFKTLKQQIESLTRDNQPLSQETDRAVREAAIKASITINAAGGVGVNYGNVVINNYAGDGPNTNNNIKNNRPPPPPKPVVNDHYLCTKTCVSGWDKYARAKFLRVKIASNVKNYMAKAQAMFGECPSKSEDLKANYCEWQGPATFRCQAICQHSRPSWDRYQKDNVSTALNANSNAEAVRYANQILLAKCKSENVKTRSHHLVGAVQCNPNYQ